MIKLYIIDDHFLCIKGLFLSFDIESDEFMVIGGSLTIIDALQNIISENVDIIILDLFIGQTNPITNFHQVKKTFPDIPIVIISAENCIAWQVEMFHHGIKAYISKSEEKSIIQQKLIRVAAGDVVIPNDVAKVVVTEINHRQRLLSIDKFKEIIDLLSHGMTAKEIGQTICQSESNIEKKLQIIRKCFNARTNAELVYNAFSKQFPEYYKH